MRVLFWTETFWPHIGGLQVFGAHVAPALAERGFELIVVTSQMSRDTPRQSVYRGIPVYRFPFQQALLRHDLAAIRAIRGELIQLKQSFRPALVHVNFSGPSDFFHLRTASIAPVPSLVTFHAPLFLEPAHNSLHAEALHASTWATAVSAALLADMRAFAPDIAARSSVVYNGLPLPDHAPSPLRCAPPRLLCAGRLVTEKGFDTVIQAMRLIRQRQPQATLTIAGDGPAREGLEQLTAERGLRDSVAFTGWVAPEAMPALMDATTVVLVPSRWREPFGLVALQAGQMARPVVATRVGGLPEVVADGETGLLVEPDDPGGLAAAVLTLLDQPAQAEAMGQAARRRAQDRFSLDQCVTGYAALYRKLGGSG